MKNYNLKRKYKKEIRIGDVVIGGKNKIAIQSMTNTDTADLASTVQQIRELAYAGCDIIRVSVYDMQCAENIKHIKRQISIPLVADIHYDYKLAIESIKQGADKIRINPGNIGGIDAVSAVVAAAKAFSVPIRAGINTGSLPQNLYEQYGGPTVQAVVHAVKDQINMLNDLGFDDIVLAAKSTDAMETVEIYRQLNKEFDYPLHVGVTESGTLLKGLVKSTTALALLLNEGISDTIRISLTDDPVNEVIAARGILNVMNIEKAGINIISCPTCARTKVDLISIANQVEQDTRHIKVPLNVAVMGCSVNGINEAKYADIGLAAGKGKAVIFSKGQIIRTVLEKDAVQELLKEIEICLAQ